MPVNLHAFAFHYEFSFLSVWVCGGLICSQCFTLYWSIFSFSCLFLSFQSRFTSSSEMHSISCFQLLLLLNLGYKSILRIPTTKTTKQRCLQFVSFSMLTFFNLLQRIKPIFSHEFYTTLQSVDLMRWFRFYIRQLKKRRNKKSEKNKPLIWNWMCFWVL